MSDLRVQHQGTVWIPMTKDSFPPPRDGSHLFMTDGTNVCWDAWWADEEWTCVDMDNYGYWIHARLGFTPLWWAKPVGLPKQ